MKPVVALRHIVLALFSRASHCLFVNLLALLFFSCFMKGTSPFIGTMPTVMWSRLLPAVTGVKDCFPDASLQG